MPKWISVEEAAAKYGINKEVIWLWADMKRFPMSYEKGITTVDEELHRAADDRGLPARGRALPVSAARRRHGDRHGV